MSGVLVAESRTDFGKGAARRLRRDGKTPAVVYGHGTKVVHIALDAHELRLTLRKKVTSFDINLDGKVETVSPRDIQIDPVTRGLEHLDLILVSAAEAATLARDAVAANAAAEAKINAAAEAAAAKAATRAENQAAEEAAGTASAKSDAPAEESAE
jgi:large subunit ribosomal protein L25